MLLFVLVSVRDCWALASGNIPLDSTVYALLDKLAGFGIVRNDMKGQKPYARAEVARLLLEAEGTINQLDGESAVFARQLIARLREIIPREVSLRTASSAPPLIDFNPFLSSHQRYVYFDGTPRSFDRQVFVSGGQAAFGFIGGHLRLDSDAGVISQSGTEGTPLLENNEGIVYRQGSNEEFRWSMEAYVRDKVAVLLEPQLLINSDSTSFGLRKGYAKLGSGGTELEVGRDENWFGPGYRGATTLTNNAKNLDQIKLSSPEPVDVGWVKDYLGDFKYKLIFSRLDETGNGADLRHPYFIGIDLSLKPRPWYEVGIHFMRMEGGPGFSGSTTLRDEIFGGGATNKNATTAGVDLRFRIPWLRNTEVYGDYSGSDSAAFWPIVESYVAGFYIPRLTDAGKDDFRFEFFYGNPKLYTDGKFPAGYVYHNMPLGHSQGGAALEFFTRYSHWFSPRHIIALEYIRTDRGHEGLVDNQVTEYKNAVRGFWNLPLYGDIDVNLMYGGERISNFNLVSGVRQTNQVFRLDLTYRY